MYDMKSVKAAFPYTLPVLAGYMFLGTAFGLLMSTKGYPLWYPLLMSVIIYAGALQFASVPLLAQSFDPAGAFIFALMINARHLFYGISMLSKYRDAGPFRYPLAHTLTDETFSVLSAADVPEGIDPTRFYLAVSLLDHSYWIAGTIIGAAAGQLLPFDLRGLDFSLTALFIVLFVEQIKGKNGLAGGTAGALMSLIALLLFGSERMVIWSMLLILIVLLAGRRLMDHE